jgi:hypothetical protein
LSRSGGDNQPVRTLGEGKDFVDINFELNHVRHFAGVKNHLVNRGADALLAVLLAHLRFQ